MQDGLNSEGSNHAFQTVVAVIVFIVLDNGLILVFGIKKAMKHGEA